VSRRSGPGRDIDGGQSVALGAIPLELENWSG
jgi:hypothetical protein